MLSCEDLNLKAALVRESDWDRVMQEIETGSNIQWYSGIRPSEMRFPTFLTNLNNQAVWIFFVSSQMCWVEDDRFGKACLEEGSYELYSSWEELRDSLGIVVSEPDLSQLFELIG